MMKTEKEVQKQVIETFKAMGYAYLGDLTKNDNENINKESLKAWLIKNQKISDERWRKIEHKIHNALKNDLYEANQTFYELLIYGVKTKISQNENFQTTYLIDWKDISKNEFSVAEEVSVKGPNAKRPDIVLYINGIALGVLELKKSSVSVESGIRQNLDNQKKEFIRDFFKTIQLVMAGNESQGLRYGVIETKEKYYLSWKEEGVLKNLFETIECFLDKKRFLEFIHDFLIFDKGQKKCARFHQYFAIKKTQEFIQRKEGGIIWHTQGSGKSLTMVWLAQWLRRNIQQARILIVTDRRELDAQIQGVFKGVGEDLYRADSKKDLLSVLFENKEFLVSSLVHKFDDNDLKQPVLKKWVVLVDECHRTQSGKLHKAMKSLLPNAIFIAFSGTPLLKQEKKTSQEVFGNYIHCYKFNEAVSDRVVLDLNYEARSVNQYVSDPVKLDEYFELKTQGLSEAAKTELKKKWVNLQKVFSTKDRLARIVQDIVLDMAKLPRLRNGKGNAMLVAESVYNACRYFELFLETELKDKVAVITSYEPNIADLKDCGSDESEESYQYRAYCKMLQNFFDEKDEKKALNKIKEFEEKVKERFINEPNRMKLLIVVDKLLTGFDAPSLTYLYIDKTMQDHKLFQAVCRVNRLDSEDKDFGCIIDYKDLFDSLQEAHSDYTNKAFENYERGDIQGLISDKSQKIKKKLEETRGQLKSLCEGVKEPKDEEDYIAYFCGDNLEKNAQKRRLFYQLVGAFLRMFVELNNLEKPIHSKEEMQPIKQEAGFYRHLQKVVGLSSGDSVDLKSYNEDMRRILDAYIKTTDSEVLFKIEDQGLCEVLAQMDINDFNKALSQAFKQAFKNESSMAESIANNTRKRIIEKEASDPKYYEKLSSLLNDLILQFREKKLTYLEYLQQIHDLAKKVIDKEDKNYPKKINTNALKTLYDNLNENEALALEIDACIRGNKKDGWVGHHQKEKNLKIALKEIIDDEGLLENVFNLAKHIEEYH
ncbi:type I restriction endonuclease subunit R [Helicobacter pylori]|uniref:type I restriction endonuclease subunit R n=1 Tax=Helicobacter pylori TaxID=210 RepID=UPI001962DAA0|nr:type I restriction endonuclease subunit R [Helicobacter pylori]NHA50869.1 type I restriction endonuclease subunit R [Helicobacter pylori]NHA99972.1 type I restriction endonuclease subunit R [Helicobacter pylori]